jgi:hypothetical protein
MRSLVDFSFYRGRMWTSILPSVGDFKRERGAGPRLGFEIAGIAAEGAEDRVTEVRATEMPEIESQRNDEDNTNALF